MKRVALMIHIIAVCIFAGILHVGQIHQARMENVVAIQDRMSGYSESIPWVAIDPVANVFH